MVPGQFLFGLLVRDFEPREVFRACRAPSVTLPLVFKCRRGAFLAECLEGHTGQVRLLLAFIAIFWSILEVNANGFLKFFWFALHALRGPLGAF